MLDQRTRLHPTETSATPTPSLPLAVVDETRQLRVDLPAPTAQPKAAGVGRFFVKLTIFGVLQLAIFGGIEAYVASFPNLYNLKRDYLTAHAPELQVVAVGTSHMLNAIDPAQMSLPTINLANYSQDFYADVRLVRHCLDRLPKLKYVVLGASYFAFDYDMSDSPNEWQTFMYPRYFGIPCRKLWSNFDVRTTSVAVTYGNDVIVPRLLQGTLGELRGLMHDDGFVGNPAPADPLTSPNDGAERAKGHNNLMHQEHYAANVADLRELLSELQRRQIQVVIVTPPVQATYLAGTKAENWQRFDAAISLMQREFAVRHLNYLKDERFTPADFSNSDHLNTTGAAKLSRLVSAELERL